MRKFKQTYFNRQFNLRFEWNGGPYIDVFLGDSEVPFVNINVWDYEKGDHILMPGEFRDRCLAWINETGIDNIERLIRA